MTTYTVSSGITSTGIILNSGNTEAILNGGTSVNTTINSGGTETVSSGGIDSGTTIYGGTETVLSGGKAIDSNNYNNQGSLLINGGQEQVTSGYTVAFVTLNSGGTEFVSNGGLVYNTTVNSGSEYISNGGIENSATINKAGNEYIYSGGVLNSATFNSGNAYVSGGVVSNAIFSGGNEYIASGGIVNSVTFNSGNETISNGGVVSGAIFNGGNEYICGVVSGALFNGGNEYISSGGTVNNATINSGSEYISAGAIVNSATFNGGNEYISSGGELNSTIINGGNVSISNGGIVNKATLNGVTWIISSGIVVSNTTLNGGTETVVKGGIDNVTTVLGGTETVLIGATAIDSNASGGSVLINGGQELVSSGFANGVTINSGGTEIISSAGIASNTIVNSRGSEVISNGGTAIGTTINTGGSEVVSSGGIDSGTTLYGGTETVVSGGSAIDSNNVNGYSGAVQINGGKELVTSGGTASYVTVNSGGTEIISNGGTANYTIINNGATEILSSGGTDSGTTVNYGGSVLLTSGATLNNDTLNGVSLTLSAGSVANGITVNNSAGTALFSTGVVSGATLNAVTGIMSISGVASNTYIHNGASEVILSGGTTSNTVLLPGGTEVVSNGGIDSGTNLASYGGGTETVLSGGIAINSYNPSNNASVQINGGTELVTSTAYYVTINNSGTEIVSSGGNAQYTTINSGGTETILNGGSDTGATVNYGGNFLVSSGATLNSDTLNGVSLTLSAGIVANGITVNNSAGTALFGASVVSGATLNAVTGIISISGVASNTYIHNGASEVILSGGTVTNTILGSGGTEVVSNGGIDSSTNLASYGGGTETVLSGGIAINSYNPSNNGSVQINGGTELVTSTAYYVTVNNSGTEIVSSGGTAQYTTINSGGTEIISNGGSDTGATVNYGGNFLVSSGATLNGDTLNGVSLTISAGIVANGITVNNSAGTALFSTGVVSGATLNAVTGIMSISGVASNTYIHNGASEVILSGGTTSNTVLLPGGTEVVSNGGIDSSTNLASYGGGTETVLSGGIAINSYNPSNNGSVQINGGTELVTSTAYYVTVNNSGTEIVSSGGTAQYTTINSGGSEYISNGGTASYTTINSGGNEYISNGGTANYTTINSGGNEIILSGGIAYNPSIASGGTEIVSSGGELQISTSTPISGLILNGGAIIDLTGTVAKTATVNAADQLVITSGSTVLDTLGLVGNYSNEQFTTQSDGKGGTDIVVKSLTTVSAVNYNAATGQLSLTGSNLTTTAANYLVSDFSLKGDGGSSYTLSSGSSILGTPTATNVIIQLSTADQLAVDGLLNNSGTKANDGLTLYNFSATGNWGGVPAPNAITTQGVTVSNVTAPIISAVAYNAATGVFTVTGANLDNHGSTNGIALTDFKLTGGATGSYSFSAGNDSVSNLTANGFTITLNSTDQAAVNSFVTDNGTGPSSGAAYNFSATGKWDSDSGAAITTQAVSVNSALPAITGGSYNAATGQLSLTGHNFTTATAGYFVNDLSLSGDGGGSYTLSSGGSVIAVPSATSLTLQLSAADQLALDGLFNHNGITANDGLTTYKLSATAGWDTSANASSGIGITVSNVSAPSISAVTYNAATGVFTVTGANLDNHGNLNGIALNDFKLSGGASGSYNFSATNDSISNLSTTGFNITLSNADLSAVNGFVTANGSSPLNGAPYNFTASALWDSDNGAPISSQAVTVNSLPASVTGVSYNAATGLLTLSGNNFNTSAGAYAVTDLSLTGDKGGSYTLSSTDTLSNLSTSGISIQLSSADQLAVDGLLNKNGSTANDGMTAYNLSAGSGWETGAAAVSSAAVTVSNVVAPTISTVSYNAATGVFTVTGSNLDNHGSLNGIAVNDFKFSGGSSSYNFIVGNDSVSNLSSSGFTLTLNSSDKTLVNSFVTDNGTAPSSGTAYNLSATANWDSDSGAAITAQAVSVNGLSPILSNVSYNAVNGQLSLTGHNLSTATGAYILTDLSLSGDGHSSYTLSSGSSVTSAGSTAVTIQLSAADQLAVDGLLNKNGGLANDGASSYSLAAAGGWTTNGAAISSQSLSVSNVTAPAISAVAYNATSGVFTVTGSNLDNHGSSNGIALGDFKLTGGASGNYGFSATNDSVSNLSATGFTITLSNADKTAVNSFVTANGSAPLSGAAYNLSATTLWDSDSGAQIGTQAVSVTGLALSTPTLNGVSYNAANGQLTLSGSNFSTSAGAYNLTDFSLTGDGGGNYSLSAADTLSSLSNSGLTIQLTTADQLAVDGLLNKTGSTANDGKTAYNLAAGSGWETGAAAITSNAVTVSNVTAPSISAVNYNAATGVFTISGSNLDNHGSANGIALNDFKLTGGSGNYSFIVGNDSVSNLSSSGFTLTLSSSDKTTVNSFVTDNGTAPSSGAAYNLSAIANWDSDSGAAITTQAINVNSLLPAISSVSYNAATGQLSLNGHDLTSSGYNVADFSLTGDGGASYTLSSADTLVGTPTSTALMIQLSTADQLAIDGLLNKNGATANDGKTAYSLAAGSGWDTGAGAANSSVTVSNATAPSLSTVSYNAATGVFTVTGSNLDNHGSANGINLTDFTLSGGAGGSYSFSATNDAVSNLTATGFTINLSSSDKTAVNAFVNANGTAPSSGAAYNLSATANWDSDSGAAITTQAVNAGNVSGPLFATVTLPANLVADSAGDLYINDLNGIDEMAVGTKTLSNLTAAANLGVDLFSVPLAVDNSGNVYAGVSQVISNGSYVSYGIEEIAAGSHALSLLPAQTANVLALAVDSSGDLFVAEGNDTVYELAAGSRAVSVIADIGNGLNGANGLTVDGHGNVYIAETNGNIVETAIGSHTLSTVLSGTPQSGGLFYAGGSLGIDSAGDVYFLSGSAAKGWAVGEIAAGSHTVSTVASFTPSTPAFLPKGVTVDGAGNLYINDYINGNIQEIATPTTVKSSVNTQADSVYLFNKQPVSGHPLSIANLVEGSGQIELSKAVYTAFAGDSSVKAVNFSDAAAATSNTDYLYYNAHTGGLYYDAHGASTPAAAVEIAVIGVSSHPADLTVADFKLVA